MKRKTLDPSIEPLQRIWTNSIQPILPHMKRPYDSLATHLEQHCQIWTEMITEVDFRMDDEFDGHLTFLMCYFLIVV